MHALDPGKEYLPAVQLRHTLTLIAPDTVENDPAGHPIHALARVTFEYDPAGQLMQVEPATSFLYFPGVHAGQLHSG
jgi:hypothetical protein